MQWESLSTTKVPACCIPGDIVFVFVFDRGLFLRLEYRSVQLALVQGKDILGVTEHVMPFRSLRFIVAHPETGLRNLSTHFWEQFLLGVLYRRSAAGIVYKEAKIWAANGPPLKHTRCNTALQLG